MWLYVVYRVDHRRIDSIKLRPYIQARLCISLVLVDETCRASSQGLTDSDQKWLKNRRFISLESTSSLGELLFKWTQRQKTRHDTLIVTEQSESSTSNKSDLSSVHLNKDHSVKHLPWRSIPFQSTSMAWSERRSVCRLSYQRDAWRSRHYRERPIRIHYPPSPSDGWLELSQPLLYSYSP